MKLTLAALLPLSACVASLPSSGEVTKQLVPRQSLFGTLPLMFGSTFDSRPVLKTVRTETLRPKLRSDAKRIRITWGPVTAYAATDKRPGYVNIFPSDDGDNPSDTGFANVIAGIPTDITMLSGKVDLTDGSGNTVSSDDKGIYLHHLYYYQLNSEKLKKEWCYGDSKNFIGFFSRKTPNIMIGAGSSDHNNGFLFTTPDAKFNSGYYLGSDARFMVAGEVVNYHKNTQYIYPTLEIEYLEGKPPGLLDVSVMLFSVTNCTNLNPTLGFRPPTGKSKFDITSDKFPLPEDGYIINAVGHMHDGGDRVISRLNGKTICDSRAQYGQTQAAAMPMEGHGHSHMGGGGDGLSFNETIVRMTECTNVIPVKAGDLVTLQGFYDLEKHGGRVASGEMLGEMAVMTMYFAAKSDDERKTRLS